jgi:putative heme-binding domain-containing protein
MQIPSGAETRATIAASLLKLNPKQHLALCASMLSDERTPMASRQKIAQSLIDSNLEEARATLVEAVKIAPERSQPKLAVILAAGKAGAETLLRETEAGKISPRLLQDRALKEKILASKPSEAEGRIGKLTANLTPLNAELQKKIEQRRGAFQPGLASAPRGMAVFEKTCAVCHQIDGKGAVVGPQLDGVGARGVERILEDVIDPNRNVDSAFRTTLFTLKDDDVVSGLFRREEGAQLVYADTTGKEITIPKDNVKERRQGELSLMPEGLADGLTPEELNDLLAFLLTKNGAKK